MKKIIFAMMAAGVFTLSSCSGDDLSEPGAQDGNVIIRDIQLMASNALRENG